MEFRRSSQTLCRGYLTVYNRNHSPSYWVEEVVPEFEKATGIKVIVERQAHPHLEEKALMDFASKPEYMMSSTLTIPGQENMLRLGILNPSSSIWTTLL